MSPKNLTPKPNVDYEAYTGYGPHASYENMDLYDASITSKG